MIPLPLKQSLFLLLFLFLAFSCRQKEESSDAYGNFEAYPVFISPDVSGKLTYFTLEEGDILKKGALVGILDTIPYYLNLQEVEVQKSTIFSKIRNLKAQTGTLREQKKNLEVELKRLRNLFASEAATQQQMDEMTGKMRVLDSQIRAMKVQQQSVQTEISVLNQKEKLVRYKLNHCYIRNPIDGTVLEKYAEAYEMAASGKPLYKIANLKKMELRVYVPAPLLSGIHLGDPADIKVDQPDGLLKILNGKVIWISSEAEFTPKIIQTRDERVKLVYAVKITVPNDGTLKIGMPGEANFTKAH